MAKNRPVVKRYVSVKNQRIEVVIHSDALNRDLTITGHDLPNGWTKMKKAEQNKYLDDYADKLLATFKAVATVVRIG